MTGAGAEQVKLHYDKEVDFGRNQIKLTAEPSVAADVKKVGAGAHLKRIEKATEAFAAALGRGPHVPFLALLDRNPPPAGTPADDEEEAGEEETDEGEEPSGGTGEPK